MTLYHLVQLTFSVAIFPQKCFVIVRLLQVDWVYVTVELLAKLQEDNFLSTQEYRKMNFADPFTKTILEEVGIGNLGCLLMILYALLVLPRESIKESVNGESKKELEDAYSKIDELLLSECGNDTDSCYESDYKEGQKNQSL